MGPAPSGRDAVALAITGASGAPYALRLLECLLAADRRVMVMVSAAARQVVAMECALELPADPAAARRLLAGRYPGGELAVYGKEEWTAPPASGSNAPRAMVICPCSMGTLAAIAHGASDTLIERAADVAIKERRRLILVPRETPLSAIHLENMLKLARLGVTLLPASPGFYHRPTAVAEVVDFLVARLLDHLDVPHRLTARWGE